MVGAETMSAIEQWSHLALEWLGFGTVVGLLAKAIMPGRDPGGPVATMVMGISGCIFGMGTVSYFCNQRLTPISLLGLMVATAGAFAILGLYRSWPPPSVKFHYLHSFTPTENCKPPVIRYPALIIVLIVLFSGCSNLTPASQADHELAGIHDNFGVTALAFTPDGQNLISGGFRGEIRIWETSTQRLTGENHAHTRAVRAILPLSAKEFVSGGDDGRLILWHQNAIKAQVKSEDVSALARFQGRLVSGHDYRLLRVWSASTLAAERSIKLKGKVMALSAHDELLAVGLEQTILLLNANFETIRVIPASRTPHDLQFSPDGRTLAARGWFRLNLWDVASGAERSIPTEHNGLLTSISSSPDGRFLATLGRHTDSAIRVLDTVD